MAVFVVLWSCLLTTKLSCLQKNNFGHTMHHTGQKVFKVAIEYRKVASSNTSCLEAHAGFFRLQMKGIFDPYVRLNEWDSSKFYSIKPKLYIGLIDFCVFTFFLTQSIGLKYLESSFFFILVFEQKKQARNENAIF